LPPTARVDFLNVFPRPLFSNHIVISFGAIAMERPRAITEESLG
jgi:hypothetical protein